MPMSGAAGGGAVLTSTSLHIFRNRPNEALRRFTLTANWTLLARSGRPFRGLRRQ
jgi:hypothetical protein